MPQTPAPTDPKQPSNSYLRFGGFAFQLLGGIGVAGWLGHQIDRYFSFEFPAFMLLFIMIVFSGMLYQMYRKLNQE
jgi:hypothetical protein